MRRGMDIRGQPFGRLTALYRVGSAPDGSGQIWRCKCVCGSYVKVRRRSLRDGSTKSCGCLRREYEKWGGVEGVVATRIVKVEKGTRFEQHQYKQALNLTRPLVAFYGAATIIKAVQQLAM